MESWGKVRIAGNGDSIWCAKDPVKGRDCSYVRVSLLGCMDLALLMIYQYEIFVTDADGQDI